MDPPSGVGTKTISAVAFIVLNRRFGNSSRLAAQCRRWRGGKTHRKQIQTPGRLCPPRTTTQSRAVRR
jgi:hypothetical protein